MIDCEETLDYEEDMESFQEENDLEEEIEEIMYKHTPAKSRQERISERMDKRKSASKESAIKVNSVPKKTLANTELDEPEIQLKCVETKNSTSAMSSSIEEYYKNAEQVEENEEQYDQEKLKTIINMFLYVDEEYAKMAAKMKDMRDEKKQYEEYILSYMEDTQKNEITEQGVKLGRKVTTRKEKPKEEDVFKTLKEVFKDDDVAKKVTEKIYESMPDVDDVKLIKDDPKKKTAGKTTKKAFKK